MVTSFLGSSELDANIDDVGQTTLKSLQADAHDAAALH